MVLCYGKDVNAIAGKCLAEDITLADVSKEVITLYLEEKVL